MTNEPDDNLMKLNRRLEEWVVMPPKVKPVDQRRSPDEGWWVAYAETSMWFHELIQRGNAAGIDLTDFARVNQAVGTIVYGPPLFDTFAGETRLVSEDLMALTKYMIKDIVRANPPRLEDMQQVHELTKTLDELSKFVTTLELDDERTKLVVTLLDSARQVLADVWRGGFEDVDLHISRLVIVLTSLFPHVVKEKRTTLSNLTQRLFKPLGYFISRDVPKAAAIEAGLEGFKMLGS